jgi:hypothetical protein
MTTDGLPLELYDASVSAGHEGRNFTQFASRAHQDFAPCLFENEGDERFPSIGGTFAHQIHGF